MKSKKGFTLIELLVVIAIIALLLSILMPALSKVKEQARRLICSTHLKSLGTGIYLYAEDNAQKLISNVHMNGNEYDEGINGPPPGTGYQNWQSYFVGLDMGYPELLKPVQLGKLFSNKYVSEVDVFYCPLARIDFTNDRAPQKIYTENLVKFMPPTTASGWGIPVAMPNGDPATRCRSNYMYWTWEDTKLYNLKNRPIVVDTLLTVAHKKNNEEPHSVNALFADGHTSVTKVGPDDEDLYNFIMADWDTAASDYNGFVKALKSLDP